MKSPCAQFANISGEIFAAEQARPDCSRVISLSVPLFYHPFPLICLQISMHKLHLTTDHVMISSFNFGGLPLTGSTLFLSHKVFCESSCIGNDNAHDMQGNDNGLLWHHNNFINKRLFGSTGSFVLGVIIHNLFINANLIDDVTAVLSCDGY